MSVYHYDNAEVAKRLLGFVLIVIGVVLITVLYYVKIRAQSAKAERARLHVQIEQEERALIVLRAELAHLESPERLSRLATDHLGLMPTPIDNIISEHEIQTRFPLAKNTEILIVSEGQK